MTKWEYTTIWWSGSRRDLGDIAGQEVPPAGEPIGDETLTQLTEYGVDGWELVGITAAPLIGGWFSPARQLGTAGITDAVHYLATLKRPLPG